MTAEQAETLTVGTRVLTPYGPGAVAYVRRDHLAPADAPMPVYAVSVRLDNRPLSAGAIFYIDEIQVTP